MFRKKNYLEKESSSMQKEQHAQRYRGIEQITGFG